MMVVKKHFFFFYSPKKCLKVLEVVFFFFFFFPRCLATLAGVIMCPLHYFLIRNATCFPEFLKFIQGFLSHVRSWTASKVQHRTVILLMFGTVRSNGGAGALQPSSGLNWGLAENFCSCSSPRLQKHTRSYGLLWLLNSYRQIKMNWTLQVV